MIDGREITDMRYIVDDEDQDKDDVEELQDLLRPSRHRSHKPVQRFHGLGREDFFGCGDPLACEDASHGDIFLFVR